MFKKALFILILSGIMGFSFPWTPSTFAQEIKLIKEGDLFPSVTLKTPFDEKDKKYLGISKATAFAIKDIKAKVILVEIMNVYCASCQNQVPIYNRLFARIASQPKIRKEIKMIGIAAGNNDQEIKIFQDHFQVSFPLIPDPAYALHKAIGGSPTPLSILVRRGPRGKLAVVAWTHLGTNQHEEELLTAMKGLLALDPKAIRDTGNKTKGQVLTAKPIYNEEALEDKIKTAFSEEGGPLTEFKKVTLGQGRGIYTGVINQDGKDRRLFAEVVSELPTCDVCHDIHYIYTFESSGKILQFIPLQLTKYGNENWTEADIAKTRAKIVGRYIYHPFAFNPKVDAVTSATITSAAIFKGLKEGQVLFEKLRKEGLL